MGQGGCMHWLAVVLACLWCVLLVGKHVLRLAQMA